MKSLLKKVAIAGNVIFILWVVYNAIDSGFSGTKPEIASFIGLILLMTLNIALLSRSS